MQAFANDQDNKLLSRQQATPKTFLVKHQEQHMTIASQNQLVESIHDDPSGLYWGPLPPLVVGRSEEHKTKNKNPLHTHQLSVIMLGFSSPG